jgi:benzoate 4-monooxygenase
MALMGFLVDPSQFQLPEECMGGMEVFSFLAQCLQSDKSRFGGSGTTANTFVFLLWGTLRHPDVVRNLKEELRNAFPDPDAIPSAMVGVFLINSNRIC